MLECPELRVRASGRTHYDSRPVTELTNELIENALWVFISEALENRFVKSQPEHIFGEKFNITGALSELLTEEFGVEVKILNVEYQLNNYIPGRDTFSLRDVLQVYAKYTVADEAMLTTPGERALASVKFGHVDQQE